MGKNNKGNRTKGNTRPSSSEHSAQLLTQSGKSFSGFIGFDALDKDIRSYIPVTGQHSSDASEISVDSDLRMIMRKMLKRDSVTRLKAVQEFGDLCAEKDRDIVKHVLPFWPRLFNKLALDYDRRIREATHQANGKLVANVKREIAPYLKNIMGVWLLGQNDLHAPAASAAQTAFVDTFPKNKQSEALMHCKNEIFSLFKDNLFEQTAKTMSDPNSTSAEDIENKYTLVISATLQAIKLFLVTVSSNEISNVQDDCLSIIADNKFWKYSKNKEPQIRGSWYSLISFLCHIKPDIFAEMEKKLVAAVFGCLSESDPVVAPAVWDSALHIVVNFENCWQGTNIHKVVLPQLWTLLNEAGRGNAHVVYPCILPFLSKFPREVITKETFLQQFFTSLKQSLLLESVKLSPMECDAILTTFMECLMYISFCVLEDTKESSALLDKVLLDHVLPLIETSFYEKKYCHLSTSKLFSLVGSLIQKIENKCLSGREIDKPFFQTLDLLWNNTYSIFCKYFDRKEEEKVKISVYISYFFHSIFMPTHSGKSEKSKVTFEDEIKPEDKSQVSAIQSFSTVDHYKKMPITFMHIIKFIKILCTKTDENVNLCYLKILDEILASTLNAEYLRDILKSYEESCDASQKASLTFFNKVILKWVSASNLDGSSITCISDIMFSLCSSVSEDEALEILNICCKVKNPVFLESILCKGLNVYAQEPVMQNWLKSTSLIECILSGFREMLESLSNNEMLNDKSIILAYKNMLLMCLSSKEIQETLEHNKNVEEIFVICKEYLVKGLNCKHANCIIDITCSIIKTALLNFKNCWSYSVTDDLLLLLFNWNLNAESLGLPEKNSTIISSVWHTAIFSSYQNNAVTRKDSFISKATKELNNCICNLPTSRKASKTFNEIMNLLQKVKEAHSSLPNNYSSAFVLSELLENILPSDFDWQTLRKNLAFSVIPSVLARKFIYNFPIENNIVSQEDVLKLYMATKVVSQIFTQEIDKHDHYEDEQYFEQYLVKQVPNLLWGLSYCSGNGYMCKDSETKLDVNVLDEHCNRILEFLSYEKLKDILKDMFYCSLSKGLYWSLPFQLLIEKMKKLYAESVVLFDEMISEATMMESDYVSLNVQILSHYISKQKKNFYLKNLLGDLTDCQTSQLTDEHLRKLSEVCCFIQDAQAIDEEVENLLSQFFTMFSLVSECPKDLSLFQFQFVWLMSSLVQSSPSLITRNAWCFMQNFLSCNLRVGKSKLFDKPDDLLFLFHVSLAYSTSFSFMSLNKADSETETKEILWEPSVEDELTESFISLFIHLGGVIKKLYSLPLAFEFALSSLLKASEDIPKNVLFSYIMQQGNETCEPKSVDVKTTVPLDNLLSILLSDIQHLQLSAHLMLMKVMPLLSESLSSCVCEDSEDDEEKFPPKLIPLVDTLRILNDLMEGMLWDIKIGDCCLVLPDTEPYAFVSAYLFTWLQMLELISTSPSQVRPGYVAHLDETKLLSSLFSNVCRLMPENPMSCCKKVSGSDSPKKENLVSLFLHPPKISAGCPSSEEIQIIACYVFCTTMHKVPASVRIWWNNLDKKSADFVNKFTSKYISGILCAAEIQALHNNENLFKNMVVKARLGTREVIATYTVDDFAIELCVQLPANYPLGPITSEKRGKIIIAQQECRHWLKQLTTVLNYQNGSILDGLNIWKRNLDKKFEGVEECMICYYILHSSTLKLPKLSCHTCRKKFHSACLYKWFHSINNTKCPLCRNEFTI